MLGDKTASAEEHLRSSVREASGPCKLTEGGGNETVGYKGKGSTGKVLQDPAAGEGGEALHRGCVRYVRVCICQSGFRSVRFTAHTFYLNNRSSLDADSTDTTGETWLHLWLNY